MAKASPALSSFASGELSPQMEGRIDVDKYPIGSHVLENFLPLIEGPLQRRAGTRYVTETKTSANRSWLRKFEFSTTQAFQIEFGDRYLRFFTNHGQVLVTGSTWGAGTTYKIGDVVQVAGINYYCILGHINHTPPNVTYWYAMTGSIYEIPSPYAIADLTTSEGLFALQFEQSGDVLYIASSLYSPYTLTRYGNTNWQFAKFQPLDGPFLEMNTLTGATSPGIALYSSGTQGSVTINAVGTNGASFFETTDVGRLIRLQSQSYNTKPWASAVATAAGDLRSFNGNNYKALNAATTGTAPPIQLSGTQWDGATGVLWQYMDSGYGIAQITAYVSGVSVTATVIQNFPADVVGVVAIITGITQANPAVVTAVNAFAVGDPVFLDAIVGMTQLNDRMFTLSATTGANFTLSGVDSTGYTAYSSGGLAIKNATVYWQLGQWTANNTGSYRGYYPSCVSFFSERLFWSGGIRWVGSVAGEYTSYAGDFNGQVTTDAAMTGVISSQDVNSIAWMSAAQILLIGTQGGEFGLSKITTTNPLGPDNVQVIRQSKKKGRAIRPELIGTSVMYVQAAAKKLMSMDYNFYIDRYDSSNQNRLSRHITKSGITAIAWAQEPNSLLWCQRADGTLIAYTYDKDDQVTAWHKHPIGGSGIVESVSVTPAPDGLRDELWLIVRRTINGVSKRYVEYMEKEYAPGDTQASCFYMDCGSTYSGAPATVISGLSFLEGQTVTILKDGGVHPDRTVSGGQITLASAGSIVNVGLRCSAKYVGMRIEAGAEVGTSQGKTKRIAIATIRVVDTIGGVIGMENSQLDNIRENDPSITLDNPPVIYSGDTQITFPGDYDSDCRIEVQNTDPVPMTLIAIFPNLQTHEPD